MNAADTDFLARAQAIRDSPKARDAAWRAGQLWWKCHPGQWVLYQQFYSNSHAEQVWDVARQWGKTFLLVLLAIEACIRIRGARVPFAAMTGIDIEETIQPMIEDEIFLDAPPGLRIVDAGTRETGVRCNWTKGRIEFPKPYKSVLKLAGCDNHHYRRLRGRRAHRWFVDEGGFIAELERVVDSVLKPQTTTTGGRGVIASSPSETPGHHFHHRYLAAKQRGAAGHFTFWENPRLTIEQKRAYVEELAAAKRMTVEEFEKTTAWRREGLAEFVLEESRAVLPEMSEALADKLTVAELSTPLWTDWYTIIDLGGSRDPTAIMCGYWDFARKKVRVQAGICLQRPTTEEIAQETLRLEREVFGLRAPDDQPHRHQLPPLRGQHYRIMDDDLGVVRRDLAIKYDLPSAPPLKDDKDAGLMDLRDALIREEIEFDPEGGKEVLAQCQAAIWNKQHTEYERVPGFGHFDLVDDLLYMHRNVVKNKGRVPPGYGIDRQNTVWRDYRPEPEAMTAALRRMVGGRRG